MKCERMNSVLLEPVAFQSFEDCNEVGYDGLLAVGEWQETGLGRLWVAEECLLQTGV